ncbi:MAG: hypothetical protein ABIV43_02645 [Candidatus Saccharimonadales bacterium]
MDFSSRNAQPATAGTAAPVSTGSSSKRANRPDSQKVTRIVTAAGAFLVAVLLVFVAITVFTSNRNSQAGFVDSSKLQAVFLNTGQVYFGKISTLNNKYFVVKDIYYLQTSSGAATDATAAANTSVSLVKLGCELHEPYDQMVINSTQVTFWENLQDNGQVAKAVATFQKQNPSGQKCADQSNASSSTTNNVQNAGNASNGSTGTTGTTNTTTTKKP